MNNTINNCQTGTKDFFSWKTSICSPWWPRRKSVWNNLKWPGNGCANKNVSRDYDSIGLQEDVVRFCWPLHLYLHDDDITDLGAGLHRLKDARFFIDTQFSVASDERYIKEASCDLISAFFVSIYLILQFYIYNSGFTLRQRRMQRHVPALTGLWWHLRDIP